MIDYGSVSAQELASCIRRGEIKALEVIEAHVECLARINPRLNALVAERFKAARGEARAADERIAAAGPGAVLPPLLGVPFSVKESIALTGMPHSSGLLARRHVRARRDAVVVARLREAGAIPLGVTNVSELCMWMESNNPVYGRTNNPYDPARTPGGSSGGEGALVGAGCVPFGVGADIGGSIRMPAFFCGVFGLKPTGGRVPNQGGFPLGTGAAADYYCTGPLARRAEDLLPLLGIMDGSGSPEPVSPLSRLRVITVPDRAGPRVAPALSRALEGAAIALAARGARLERHALPRLRHGLSIWATMLSAGSTRSFSEDLGVVSLSTLVSEIVRLPLGRARHTLPALGLAAIERLTPTDGAVAKRVLAEGATLRRELAALLGDDGVLLYPPHPVLAPRHNRPLLSPTNWVYTAIFNVLENPVVQVPLGLDPRGLPLGVQVVAPHGREDLAVTAALALEEAFGGWRPPPGIS